MALNFTPLTKRKRLKRHRNVPHIPKEENWDLKVALALLEKVVSSGMEPESARSWLVEAKEAAVGEIVCPIATNRDECRDESRRIATIATASRFAIFLGPKNNPGLFIALGMQIGFSLEPTQGYFWPWLLFGYHESYGRNALRKRFYHTISPNRSLLH